MMDTVSTPGDNYAGVPRGGVPGGVGIGGGGHIDAFLRGQGVGSASASVSLLSPHRVGSGGGFDEDFEAVGGGAGGNGGRFRFPRSVTAGQLQLRLQKTVFRLEEGMSSQLPFEVVEAEVQVREWNGRTNGPMRVDGYGFGVGAPRNRPTE